MDHRAVVLRVDFLGRALLYAAWQCRYRRTAKETEIGVMFGRSVGSGDNKVNGPTHPLQVSASPGGRLPILSFHRH